MSSERTAEELSAGFARKASVFPAAQTLDRFEQLVAEKGNTIFARIDHAAGAREAGMTLRPTQLLLFGNPKGGTPLMMSRRSIGIDLPLRALAWEDEEGRVWLAYTDPVSLAARHGITDHADLLRGLAANLDELTRIATTEDR